MPANITVDDAQIGLQNGASLVYTGELNWDANSYANSPCPLCLYHPTPSGLVNGTWHDGRPQGDQKMQINLSFTGDIASESYQSLTEELMVVIATYRYCSLYILCFI